MRFRITVVTTVLLTTSLVFPSLAYLKTNGAMRDRKSASGPPAGVFRVVLNGFKVNHESDDDILEGDGKRDEVYLRADVWVLNRDGSVPYRRSPRSMLMGDIHNQSDPPRTAAGTASDDGGLRTNDKWPINEQWRRVTNPLLNRPPMLLWEGELVQGGNMAVIGPTVWEWDSRGPSRSERLWDGEQIRGPWPDSPTGADGWFTRNKQACLNRIASNSREFLLDDDYPILLGEKSGTRPIGEFVVPHWDYIHLKLHALTLTYDAAVQAVRSTPSGVGYGVIALDYFDQEDHGDYTLYVQIEQIK